MDHHPYQIIASILVWLLYVSPSPSTASNSQVVLDRNYNPVEVGTMYYVTTYLWGTVSKRGGLYPEPGPLKECPRYAAQIRNLELIGVPVVFYSANSSQKHITEDEDINISFAPIREFCKGDSGVWNLIFVDGVSYVATNGTRGDPQAEGTWFKIQRVPNSGIAAPPEYRIVYCVLRTPALGLGLDLGLNQQVEFCQQLDATQSAPAQSFDFTRLFYLSLVSLNQSLPFNGFVFFKALTSVPTY